MIVIVALDVIEFFCFEAEGFFIKLALLGSCRPTQLVVFGAGGDVGLGRCPSVGFFLPFFIGGVFGVFFD